MQKVGEQPAVMQQMVEQWFEVPKILPQDRILQTAKQMADLLVSVLRQAGRKCSGKAAGMTNVLLGASLPRTMRSG